MLKNGTGDTLIEYCHFKTNGEVKSVSRSSSLANLMIFSDYKYEDAIDLCGDTTGYCTATQGNEIRYNMFEADAGNGNFTTMNHSDEVVGYMGFCNN